MGVTHILNKRLCIPNFAMKIREVQGCYNIKYRSGSEYMYILLKSLGKVIDVYTFCQRHTILLFHTQRDTMILIIDQY